MHGCKGGLSSGPFYTGQYTCSVLYGLQSLYTTGSHRSAIDAAINQLWLWSAELHRYTAQRDERLSCSLEISFKNTQTLIKVSQLEAQTLTWTSTHRWDMMFTFFPANTGTSSTLTISVLLIWVLKPGINIYFNITTSFEPELYPRQTLTSEAASTFQELESAVANWLANLSSVSGNDVKTLQLNPTSPCFKMGFFTSWWNMLKTRSRGHCYCAALFTPHILQLWGWIRVLEGSGWMSPGCRPEDWL